MDENSAQNLPISDLSPLAQAASEFASYPGMQTDASVKEFLDRFPLPVIFSALQSEADVPGLENALVSCLERIFSTKYGSSFILQYVPLVQGGLQAYSQTVRCLASKTVSYLLVNAGDTGAAVQLVIKYDIYRLLLNSLIEGLMVHVFFAYPSNELVAAASTDAIVNIARSPGGIDIVFPTNSDESTQLNHVAARCSSLARVRVLALIVKLFSISSLVASAVYDSKLLGLLEAEVNNTDDMLTTLSALELLYELAESPHGTKFLLKTSLLQLLTSIIRNTSLESILRSRAILISGRLLSSDDTFTVSNEFSIRTTLLAIDARLESLKDQHADECESAFEALGQIGSSIQGASFLLSTPSPVARHVVEAAFDRQGRGKQLAALHALANISGENRLEDSMVLNDDAEECLRSLVYATAASSSKLTPSGLFLSLLQQDSEIRLAAYRVIAGLVIRRWCLLEICSKLEIINIVTDAHMETAKNGMEARFKCCIAINKALSASSIRNDGALAEISTKLQEAVRRGPYLAKGHSEAQPAVMTAERF